MLVALVIVSVAAAVTGIWMMASRFVRALADSEAMAATLEDRVREKERDLEWTYGRLGELERMRILAEERERIQREMHDGIGGRLVSALAVISGGATDVTAVKGLLRRAIGDLRLVVETVGSEPGELTTLLGSLRERLETDSRAARLELKWRVEDVPGAPVLGPAKSVQIIRIVEEAFANVIRHAAATHVSIRAFAEPGAKGGDGMVVEIADDGRGLAAAHVVGRGLANMRRRAEEIGGELDVRSRGEGTAVRLWLPLAESPE